MKATLDPTVGDQSPVISAAPRQTKAASSRRTPKASPPNVKMALPNYMNALEQKTSWPHAPVHKLNEAGTYMVTAGTYQKQHFLSDTTRLDMLQRTLLEVVDEFEWDLQAWAVLSNHYHFIVACREEPRFLKSVISKLHSRTAIELNDLDQTPGRRVWYQFYDTRITFEQSYFARLKYVHNNPVHHKIVERATDYHWCSAGWFEHTANPAFRATVDSFKIDRLNVYDDF